MLRAASQERIALRRLPEGDWTIAAGHRIAHTLRVHEADGIVAANDRMAIGAIHALQEQGLSVPGEVQVVGFDDGPEAALVEPSLSTMRLNFDVVGIMAVRAALRLSRGIAGDTEVRSNFVERESVHACLEASARVRNDQAAAV